LISPERSCGLSIKAARRDWRNVPLITCVGRLIRAQPGQSGTKEIEARDVAGDGVNPQVPESPAEIELQLVGWISAAPSRVDRPGDIVLCDRASLRFVGVKE
jgi:hypothetical protein